MNTRRVAIGLAICGWLMVAGCREDREPPRVYEPVMSDGTTALASMPGPMLDPRLVSGSAQFPEFRPPSEDDFDSGSAGPQGGGAIAEVQALIEEYNGLVDDKSHAELAEYYVEEQREAIAGLITLSGDALAKLGELGDALKEAMPDESDRIDDLLETLNKSSSLKLTVSGLTASGDGVVTGTVPSIPGMPNTVTFRVVEYEGESNWFIDSPMVAMAGAMKPMIEAQLASWDQTVAAIKSDPSTAEQTLAALEAAANMAAAASGGAGESDDDSDDGE